MQDKKPIIQKHLEILQRRYQEDWVPLIPIAYSRSDWTELKDSKAKQQEESRGNKTLKYGCKISSDFVFI